MSVQHTGIGKALWLQMLSEGGYSTIGELRTSLKLGGKRIDRILEEMAERGFCHKYRNPERKNGAGYGVTATCKVPQNVQLKDILSHTVMDE